MARTAHERPAPARRPRSFRLVFTRYTIGSVLAAAASEATLLMTYGAGLLGPRAASVAAWVAGAMLNYALNRWWAWGRRGRASLRRELVPYWAISVASLIISAWATGAADRLVPRLTESAGARVAFVGGAFLAVYGLMFIVKFCLFHYLVFARGPDAPSEDAADQTDGTPRRRRSRHHVPMTTRE